jgi:hypothetical protein
MKRKALGFNPLRPTDCEFSRQRGRAANLSVACWVHLSGVASDSSRETALGPSCGNLAVQKRTLTRHFRTQETAANTKDTSWTQQPAHWGSKSVLC